MSTFVLVHGAWGGAHGFRHLRQRLQAAGHHVFTPSLTGIGERVHLARPLVGLGIHIRDVVNQLLYEDLQGIVLLRFSYGGFVVTGALEHIADRVRHLVYLDAFVPASGDTVWAHVRGAHRSPITLDEDWLLTGPTREFDDPAEAPGWHRGARRIPQAALPSRCTWRSHWSATPSAAATARPPPRCPTTRGNAAFWRAARHAQASADWR